MGLEGRAPGPCQAGLGDQLWGPWIPGCPVARELVASWNCQGRLVQGKTQAERTGGRGRGELEGLTKSLQQAQSSGVAQKGAGGRAGEHWAPGHSSPPVVGKRGGWKLAQGLGDRQGLSQTLAQWRGEASRHHATLPIPTPGADITNRDYIIGIILPSPTKPRPNLRSSAQPPPATPDSAGLRHFVIQLPALV